MNQCVVIPYLYSVFTTNVFYLQNINLVFFYLSLQASGFPYVCSHVTCGATFKSKSGYQQHMKRHLGIFKYHCPYCQKGLGSSEYVKEHLRIHHTGLHGYHCNKCRQEFPNVSKLRIHLDQNQCQDQR